MLPSRITIQWHLTEICNYRCKHCYQESYQNNGASYNELIDYLNKITEFILKLSNKQNHFKAHINFTGGEPFLKENFLNLLQEVNNSSLFSFGILSNGFLLPESELKILKELKPRFIQISLEGNEAINDEIRGKGSFKDVIRAIKAYNKLKIPVLISFTANAKNYKSFPEVVKICRKHKVHKIWTDRYLPKNINDDLSLSTNQVKDFFQIILNEQKNHSLHFYSKTKISSDRALQFLVTGREPYNCSAGKTLLAILPNGDILPCRRLPIKVGNLKTDNLFEIYQTQSLLQSLRIAENLDKDCLMCYYKTSCNGGLKCLTYANYGVINKKDVNCWI